MSRYELNSEYSKEYIHASMEDDHLRLEAEYQELMEDFDGVVELVASYTTLENLRLNRIKARDRLSSAVYMASVEDYRKQVDSEWDKLSVIGLKREYSIESMDYFPRYKSLLSLEEETTSTTNDASSTTTASTTDSKSTDGDKKEEKNNEKLSEKIKRILQKILDKLKDFGTSALAAIIKIENQVKRIKEKYEKEDYKHPSEFSKAAYGFLTDMANTYLSSGDKFEADISKGQFKTFDDAIATALEFVENLTNIKYIEALQKDLEAYVKQLITRNADDQPAEELFVGFDHFTNLKKIFKLPIKVKKGENKEYHGFGLILPFSYIYYCGYHFSSKDISLDVNRLALKDEKSDERDREKEQVSNLKKEGEGGKIKNGVITETNNAQLFKRCLEFLPKDKTEVVQQCDAILSLIEKNKDEIIEKMFKDASKLKSEDQTFYKLGNDNKSKVDLDKVMTGFTGGISILSNFSLFINSIAKAFVVAIEGT